MWRSRFRRALPQTPLISAVVAPDPLNPAIAKALVRLHPDLLLNIYPNGDANQMLVCSSVHNNLVNVLERTTFSSSAVLPPVESLKKQTSI